MVGLGAQDTLEEAEEFVATYSTTFTMLWDASFESWANLGVSLQPSSILIGADGTLLGKWLGPIPEDNVLEIVGGAAPVGEVAGNSSRFCGYASRYVTAQRVLDGVDDIALGERAIVFDDIRFAANAMAQTSSDALAPSVRAFSDSVRELAAAAIDHDFDLAAARTSGRYDELDVARKAAVDEISDDVNDECDVGLAS